MKLTLGVLDRLRISELFPAKGSISDQMLARDILKKTEIETEESEEIGLKHTSISATAGRWEFDGDKAKDKEIEFTGAQMNFLKARVTDMDNRKEDQGYMLNLCVMIRDATESEPEKNEIE